MEQNNVSVSMTTHNILPDCPRHGPGGHTLAVLHVEPAPELRVPVKLDGAGVVAQVARPPRTRHRQRVGRVVHGVRAEAPHLGIYTFISTYLHIYSKYLHSYIYLSTYLLTVMCRTAVSSRQIGQYVNRHLCKIILKVNGGKVAIIPRQ